MCIRDRPTASQKDVRERYSKFYGDDWTKWHRLAQVAAGYGRTPTYEEKRAADKFMIYVNNNEFGPNWNRWRSGIRELVGIDEFK